MLFPRVAVIVTAVLLRTNGFVVIWKFALVEPVGTVTLPGTTMKELFEDNPTTEPPAGAAALKVTVPVEVWPFAMVDGFTVSDVRVRPLHAPPLFGVSWYTVP